MSQPHADFLAHLRADLSGPLPGEAAQLRMAPRPRTGDTFRAAPGDDVRMGGVLALLYPHNGQINLPLILRPTYRGVHSGQVAFPGGGREPGDADLIATALREGNEEVGIDPARVTVLGQLTPLFVFASNYLVQPTLAWSEERPAFQTDPYEVALLLEVPLADLLNPANLRRETWALRGRSVEVPIYAVAGQTIWGATAMMLSELLSLPAIAALRPASP